MPAAARTTTEISSPAPIPIFKLKRRPRPTTQINSQTMLDHHPDPNHPISSIIQSTKCKSSLSSLLLSTFTNTHHTTVAVSGAVHGDEGERKRSSRGSALKGFGCTAHPDVAVPAAVVRASADWENQVQREKNKDRKNKNKSKKNQRDAHQLNSSGVHNVYRGPGLGIAGFRSLADDCVVSTRPLSGRGKIDVDKVKHHQRSSYSLRQRVNLDYAPPDLDSVCDTPFGSEVLEDRSHHHVRNHSDEEVAEIMMFRNGILSRWSGGLDRFHGWRLDVDSMSYEELLALGDRIGYVNTGLREDEIRHCIRKTKLGSLDYLSLSSSRLVDKNCSICQEEYEAESELGKLSCGHSYHIQCIKQWLAQKNICPICKSSVVSR